jgi:uncharacterized coiled-coil protein SlyX
MLKSAIVALQCRHRVRVSKAIFSELMKEQKDVGKLKGQNEKLKDEMASLRAMLASQAKESAASIEHEKVLAVKQQQIDKLEKRIAELEKELADAKSTVTKLEAGLLSQMEASSKDKDQLSQMLQRRQSVRNVNSQDSPISHRRKVSGVDLSLPADYVSPDALNAHRAKVAKLEDELDSERQFRREADGEIIRLRAAMNGVKLDEDMVNDLLAPQAGMTRSEESSVTSEDPSKTRYALRSVCSPSRSNWC